MGRMSGADAPGRHGQTWGSRPSSAPSRSCPSMSSGRCARRAASPGGATGSARTSGRARPSAPGVRRSGTCAHGRTRTADVPDEPATYEFVNAMNQLAALSAYAYDPADGTISARCGAFLYGDVAPWLQSYLLVGAALQASFAWQMVPAMADGRTLDDAAHPASGPRHDPDDMLNAAGTMKPMACPITRPDAEARPEGHRGRGPPRGPRRERSRAPGPAAALG